MLTVDTETFEAIAQVILAAARHNPKDNHTIDEDVRRVLSLLGLQAPEQQQTSGAAGRGTESVNRTESAECREPASIDAKPTAPELTTKGGDAMQPVHIGTHESAGGRVGTDSPRGWTTREGTAEGPEHPANTLAREALEREGFKVRPEKRTETVVTREVMPPYETKPRLDPGVRYRVVDSRGSYWAVGEEFALAHELSGADGWFTIPFIDGSHRVVRVEPEKAAEAERKYPCAKCGLLRTVAEGGTTFTTCDACWDKPHDGGGERRNCIFDEGPPRVGDVVRVDEIHPLSWSHHEPNGPRAGFEFKASRVYLDALEGFHGIESPDLSKFGASSLYCRVTVIRRAGQPEKCEKCGGDGMLIPKALNDDGVRCPACKGTGEKARSDG